MTVGPKMAGATIGIRSRGGGGVQRLASEQEERAAAGNCSVSDMIWKVQLMGGAEGPRGVEFDTDPPFHLKLLRGVGGRNVRDARLESHVCDCDCGKRGERRAPAPIS